MGIGASLLHADEAPLARSACENNIHGSWTMRIPMTSVGRAFLAGALLAATSLAQAQLTPAQSLIQDKFVFNLGGFILGTDVTAHLNGSSTTNPDIDFDKTFGEGSDSTRVRADALWRITPNHHLRFLYFNNTNTSARAIDRNIAWGDYTFQAGATVDSRTKFQIYELAYEYAFFRTPDVEVSGSFGVHYMKLSQQLSGTATFTDANGVTSAASFTRKENSVPVPLPVLGARVAWAFAPQWVLEGQGQVFKADISGYDGKVTDLRAGVTWMFSQNFGAGVGYNRFVTTVETSKEKFDGHVRLGYSGVQLYLTGAF